jgi:hypothetical protein
LALSACTSTVLDFVAFPTERLQPIREQESTEISDRFGIMDMVNDGGWHGTGLRSAIDAQGIAEEPMPTPYAPPF